jgi:glutathione S-transferase
MGQVINLSDAKEVGSSVTKFERPISGGNQSSFGGGPPGGSTVDQHTRDYVDANVAKTRAENDSRFAELRADISALAAKIDGVKSSGRDWAIGTAVAIVVTIAGIFFTYLQFGHDRFDAGLEIGIGNSQQTEQNRAAIERLEAAEAEAAETRAAIREILSAVRDDAEGDGE